MTTKDVLALVDRKYKLIKEEAVKEVEAKITEAVKYKEAAIMEIKRKLNAQIPTLLGETKLTSDIENLVSISSYNIDYPEIAKLNSEKAEIVKSIEKERNAFIDEIIVLGIKDNLVKEKITQLLDIK